jgi:hypothetical protein
MKNGLNRYYFEVTHLGGESEDITIHHETLGQAWVTISERYGSKAIKIILLEGDNV